jgi:hypothetical protein
MLGDDLVPCFKVKQFAKVGPAFVALALSICAAFAAAAQSAPLGKGSSSASDAMFGAVRLRTGRFDYQIMQNGKQIATFAIAIEKQADGNFRFAAKGLNQEWESIATSSFAPISAALRIERPEKKIYSMNLKYGENRVTGSTGTTAKEVTNEVKRTEMKPVNAEIPAGTVDQRIDWAAMLASRLEIGRKISFSVYDPATGVSKVAGEIGKVESTQVPAGTFETIRVEYRIEKSKGTETYEVLASKGTPRFIVRETFSNGMSTELVKIGD